MTLIDSYKSARCNPITHEYTIICRSKVRVFERESPVKMLCLGSDRCDGCAVPQHFLQSPEFLYLYHLCWSETITDGARFQISSVLNLCTQMRLTLWFSRAESLHKVVQCAMHLCLQFIVFVYIV